MPHKKNFRLSGLFVLMLLGGSLLWACGDSGPTYTLTLATSAPTPSAASPAASTAANASAGSADGSQPTSTPVIVNTPVAATPAPATSAAGTTRAASATVRPTATPLPTLQAPQGYTGKLALLGPDNALYILKFDGSQPVVALGSATAPPSATQDGEVIEWPTWSKDGSKLAAMSLNIKSGQVATTDVVVTDGNGKNPVKVQEGDATPPVFISWSPDGNLLSVLGQGAGGSQLELHLLDTSKSSATTKPTDRKVAEGSAIYTGWSPDSQQLLIHTSTSSNTSALALLAAKDSQAQPTALKVTPSLFRSPAFSADGSRRAFSVTNSTTGNEDIVIQDKDGNDAGKLDSGGKNANFSWSPTGTNLAFGIANPSSQGLYKGISLVTVDPTATAPTTLTATQVVTEDVAAFFWSPDGKKLAYVTLNDTGDMLLWKLYDTTTKKSSTITEWFPSENWGQLITFFDQYAQSNSVWSPDSKALVFAGLSKDDYTALVESGATDSLQPQVYILPVDGTNAGIPQAVGYGSLAFWSK
ncbi:MAG: PD40 domain-containing protein [Chloroflexi bacterium]|nr:PD40 domain-containing protein [Chloroflexota bacterium]OJW06390.1 MAG: hypothetical protein BGO39_07860 [Chloroflexi bacterium 54-19]